MGLVIWMELSSRLLSDARPFRSLSFCGSLNLDEKKFLLQYKTCKDGSVLGVTVTRIALLTHCQALTQACGYTEGISALSLNS